MDFSYSSTREGRANNVFGVSASSTYQWENINKSRWVPNKEGIYIPGIDNELGDKLVIFQTFQDGLNAGFWLFWRYFVAGFVTAETIGDRWSGDTEARALAQHRESYGFDIAEIMKVDVNWPLHYISDCKNLSQAIMRMENSADVFKNVLVNIPPAMYDVALEYGQRSKPTQKV